jgi:hypothetical protein
LTRIIRVRGVTLVRVEGEAAVDRAQRHPDQPGLRQRDRGGVGVVVGLEGDHLVARLAQREHRGGDRLGRAHRDQDLARRLVGEGVVPGPVLGHGLPQLHDAGARRILVGSRPDRVHGPVQHRRRPVGVGKALTQVDRSGLGGQGAHFRKNRGAEGAHPRNKWFRHMFTLLNSSPA